MVTTHLEGSPARPTRCQESHAVPSHAVPRREKPPRETGPRGFS